MAPETHTGAPLLLSCIQKGGRVHAGVLSLAGVREGRCWRTEGGKWGLSKGYVSGLTSAVSWQWAQLAALLAGVGR